MPFALLNQSISGTSSAVLSGSRVLYFAWNITAEGQRVRQAIEEDPLSRAGIGYVSFGDDLTAIGDGVADHWDNPIWLNHISGRWVPYPSLDASGFTYVVATRIRWSLSVGTAGHIYVFGDT
jgi:hypothetical protein